MRKGQCKDSGLDCGWAVEYAGKLERRTYGSVDDIDHTNTMLALIPLAERGKKAAFRRIIDRYFEVFRATGTQDAYLFISRLCQEADQLAGFQHVESAELFSRLYPRPQV